jgi:hypothetical protein
MPQAQPEKELVWIEESNQRFNAYNILAIIQNA